MGKVIGTQVAVKTVKPNTERDVLISLLAEIKIMSHLEGHPNIVELVGANTDGLASGWSHYELGNKISTNLTSSLSFCLRSSIHFCRVLSIRQFGVLPKKEQEFPFYLCGTLP
jgi:serine/threonine protein kinase